MTDAQKLQLRLSEIRQKLNALAAVDQPTEEQRTEMKALTAEYPVVEERSRAALIAEDAEDKDAEDKDAGAGAEDAEGKELRSLIEGAELGEIVRSALSGPAPGGRTAELLQHFKLEANQVPIELLAGPPEQRAAATVPGDVGVNQAPILPFVFPRGVAASLMIPMPTVPVGERTYPVLTNAADVHQPAKGAPADESTAVFSTTNLAPRRLQAQFSMAIEDRAVFAGLSEALRQNLNDALSDELDKAIIGGAEGLLGRAIAVPGNPTEESNWAAYKAAVVGAVDGVYADSPGSLRLVAGVETYQHASLQYRTDRSDDDAWMAMQAMVASLRLTPHVPAVTSKRQDAIIALGSTPNAQAPIWQGATLLEDPYTRKAHGEIALTATLLYAFAVTRSAGFKRARFQVEA